MAFIYLKIRAVVEAKKESIKQKNSDTYLISVKQSASRGLANKRIIEIMAELLKISKDNILIVKGQYSPSKILLIIK